MLYLRSETLNLKTRNQLFFNMKQRLLYGILVLCVFVTSSMSVCAIEPDANGVYQIGNATDLVAFADSVNAGQYSANAVLTADITFTEAWTTPIGVAEAASFTGIFDGQGHKISGFNAESNGMGGFFGCTKGATIKNFSIDGSITVLQGTGTGVVGWPASSTISNVHSALVITATDPGLHHVGGVVGSARGGNTISSCTFSGSLTVGGGSTDNFAGIVAYLGGDSVVYCTNYGTITFSGQGSAVGGIAGYLNNTGSYVKGCLNLGKVVCDAPDVTPTFGGAIVGRLRNFDAAKLTGNCWLEGSAYGAGRNDSGVEALTAAVSFTADKMATGAVCYALNGDQKEIGWYQTIGTDEAPVLDNTHKQVYMNGRLHCNGDVYDDAVYSNENTGVTQDEHNIVDGFCSYCGLFDVNYLTPNADGYYELSNAKQLVWFERMVNTGRDSLNAVLTADIDFAPLTEDPNFSWTAIGDWGGIRGTASAAYRGHFNGQGHTITNFDITSTHNYYGLFGVVSNGSLVENFDIYGTMNLGHKTGAVVAYTRDATCTIRNIHSYMTINVTEAATTAERPGGIVGSANNGTTIIENCIYSGTLNVGEHTGNIGGIVGYINNNSAAIVNITNCLFDGEIQNGYSADGQCGGIVGYNNGGKATIKNCLSIGTIVSSEGNIGQFIGRLNGSNTVFGNNYYKGDFVNGSKSGKTAGGTAPENVEGGQLASGEITWKLNEESFVDPAWRQTLGEDEYPIPYGEADVVYQTSTGYNSISDAHPESFYSFRDDVISKETDFIEDEDLKAYKVLVNQYKEAIQTWSNIDTFSEFIAAYKAASVIKDDIKKSEASYASYAQACKAAADYIEENNLEGEYTDFLKSYLEEDVEPNNDYPNGSSSYIMENLNLDDEELVAEIAFVNKMLENALAGGVTPGTEITRLMTNPTFTQGEDKFEGWNKEANDGATFATGGVPEIMNIARGKNGNFDINQTLTDVPNGVYMMTINGLFLSGGDIYSEFNAGQFYMNNTSNYAMTSSEDIVLDGDEKDMENCLLSDDKSYMDGDVLIGYVPATFKGCSYAYNSGRYQNFCATEVTDGKLTVGMRNLGTGVAGDWLPFGNLHVFYLGNTEEANEKLTTVLEGFVARAQSIVNLVTSDGYSDVFQKPNISAQLKAQLSEAIERAGEATVGEEKMTLINTFSALFDEVYACRKAYIAMINAASGLANALDALQSAGIIDDDEWKAWDNEVYDAVNSFVEGTVSTEEALAIADRLNLMDKLMPQVDGIYQLSTVKQVQLFSIIVNNGSNDAKAVLMNDIDMSECTAYTPIGSSSTPFKGEFDGQGYKITNLVMDPCAGDAKGFIGYASGATIKNFSISGKITYTDGTGVGAIGWATGTALSNIHSTLDIAVVSTAHHIGGVCGHLSENSSATNCSFAGTITETGGSHDCIGGIGAYSNNGVKYENCANYGTITYSAANAYAGGICGYVNNDSFTGVFNCLNVGKVGMAEGSPSYGGAFVGRLRSHAGSQFVNNYMLEGSAPNTSGENKIDANVVSADALASGEVCYKLNGDKQGEDIVWFQTLKEDLYPVLDNTHSVVLYDEVNGYHNEVLDPDAIENINVNDNDNDGAIYNIAGQRISKLQKGINIVNGKKILY